jgi:hypothetical protein
METLEAVISIRYYPIYKREFIRELNLESRVEVALNTSTVAQRAVGGDEKGTHCLGV